MVKRFFRPKPMEYVGYHLPNGCGCYPHEIYRKVLGYDIDKRGKRTEVVLLHRHCLN